MGGPEPSLHRESTDSLICMSHERVSTHIPPNPEKVPLYHDPEVPVLVLLFVVIGPARDRIHFKSIGCHSG